MRTSGSIFISSLLLLLTAMPLMAQSSKGTAEEESSFAFKGVSVGVDTYGYINTLFDDYVSSEVAVQANFGNRFFPVVEIGYGSTDTTDDMTGIYYKSGAPYFRLGMNYNFLYKKKGKLSGYKLYGLARYGWTKAEYDVKSPLITDPVWGGTTELDLTGIEASCSWFELGVGVQVKVWKIFHMGWSIRYKSRLKEGEGENSQVWYIPGYGENKSNSFGGTCSLIIDIPFGKNQ